MFQKTELLSDSCLYTQLTWNSPHYSALSLFLRTSLHLPPPSLFFYCRRAVLESIFHPEEWNTSFQGMGNKNKTTRHLKKKTILLHCPPQGRMKNNLLWFEGFKSGKESSCSYVTANISFLSAHIDRKFNNYCRAQTQNMISMDPDDNGFYMQLQQRGNYSARGKKNNAGEWDNCLVMSDVSRQPSEKLFILRFFYSHRPLFTSNHETNLVEIMYFYLVINMLQECFREGAYCIW